MPKQKTKPPPPKREPLPRKHTGSPYRAPDQSTMTVGEVADFLGLSPNTVRLWANEGRLPSWRLPGKQPGTFGARRFRRAEIEALRLVEGGDPA